MNEPMRQIVLQEINEERFSRKHIDRKIRDAIEGNKAMMAKVAHGKTLVELYLRGQYYESKDRRVKALQAMDAKEMVMDLFVGVAYVQRPELFTTVSAQMAARLKLSDRVEAIASMAELLAVLCQTDAFDITKENKQASLMLVSRLLLPPGVIKFIEESQYLPPMVCKPLELKHNYSSGYLQHNDSLMLGSGNHHDGDLCLDVLNIMNGVALSINEDFIRMVDEEPTSELITQEQCDQWNHFVDISHRFYDLIVSQGNRFYFHHRVDKRGRIYAQGYHINSQGTSYKKAMLELADAEHVNGTPDDHSEAALLHLEGQEGHR